MSISPNLNRSIARRRVLPDEDRNNEPQSMKSVDLQRRSNFLEVSMERIQPVLAVSRWIIAFRRKNGSRPPDRPTRRCVDFYECNDRLHHWQRGPQAHCTAELVLLG